MSHGMPRALKIYAGRHSELKSLMAKDKIFCDEDLSLKRLAVLINVTPHQLSEFLNSKMNMNFNAFIKIFSTCFALLALIVIIINGPSLSKTIPEK